MYYPKRNYIGVFWCGIFLEYQGFWKLWEISSGTGAFSELRRPSNKISYWEPRSFQVGVGYETDHVSAALNLRVPARLPGPVQEGTQSNAPNKPTQMSVCTPVRRRRPH